jgi:hypothetical protein
MGQDERRAGHFIGWMLLVHGLLFALAGVNARRSQAWL